MPLEFAPEGADALPLHVIEQDALEGWLADQSATVATWVQAAGFTPSVVAENIAAGQRTPQEVVEKIGRYAELGAQLAQARLHGDSTGHWPIILLDDLASELDRQHQSRVLQQLQDSGAQVFLTGTEQPEAVQTLSLQPRMFHVEHGRISA